MILGSMISNVTELKGYTRTTMMNIFLLQGTWPHNAEFVIQSNKYFVIQ